MPLTHKQLLIVACGIALQAFILVVLNPLVAMAAGADLIWVAFQAWAMYFLAGCTMKGGIKALIGYFTGIVASVAIILLMGCLDLLSNVGGVNLAMALAVFTIVIPAIWLSETLKNMVPALFVGSGAFFALTAIMWDPALTDWQNFTAITRAEMVYCAYGLLFGFITVFWRGRYEASLSKGKSKDSSE